MIILQVQHNKTITSNQKWKKSSQTKQKIQEKHTHTNTYNGINA
jgi:hypothetical protein